MENNIPLHFRTFNDKVLLMNQSGKQNITLSANEARSLQHEIFDLLAQCAAMSKALLQNKPATNEVRMDGGQW